jgi:hypothetical protein
MKKFRVTVQDNRLYETWVEAENAEEAQRLVEEADSQ